MQQLLLARQSVPTTMDDSENVQNENVSQPSHLTRDQEHEIMVSTLRQVISSSGTSNLIGSEALPPPDAGPCPICGVTGCYGCAFPRPVEINKEKKHKGVRKKPSGKWAAEIWIPSMRKRRWLGTFPTHEMAVQAYEEAAAKEDNGGGTSHQVDGVSDV